MWVNIGKSRDDLRVVKAKFHIQTGQSGFSQPFFLEAVWFQIGLYIIARAFSDKRNFWRNYVQELVMRRAGTRLINGKSSSSGRLLFFCIHRCCSFLKHASMFLRWTVSRSGSLSWRRRSLSCVVRRSAKLCFRAAAAAASLLLVACNSRGRDRTSTARWLVPFIWALSSSCNSVLPYFCWTQPRTISHRTRKFDVLDGIVNDDG